MRSHAQQIMRILAILCVAGCTARSGDDATPQHVVADVETCNGHPRSAYAIVTTPATRSGLASAWVTQPHLTLLGAYATVLAASEGCMPKRERSGLSICFGIVVGLASLHCSGKGANDSPAITSNDSDSDATTDMPGDGDDCTLADATCAPSSGASADGTTVPPASSITDSLGKVWTLTGDGKIAVNGVVDPVTMSVVLLLYYKGVVYQETSIDDAWWAWIDNGWVRQSGDPRVAQTGILWGINAHPVQGFPSSAIAYADQMSLLVSAGLKSYRMDVYTVDQMSTVTDVLAATKAAGIVLLIDFLSFPVPTLEPMRTATMRRPMPSPKPMLPPSKTTFTFGSSATKKTTG